LNLSSLSSCSPVNRTTLLLYPSSLVPTSSRSLSVDLASWSTTSRSYNLGSLFDGRVSGKGSRATCPSAHRSRSDDEAVRDMTYMGVGLGSNVDTGVCASHTPEDVRVTLLLSSAKSKEEAGKDVRCMSARRTSLFGESDESLGRPIDR
jgi:hypothetical protein